MNTNYERPEISEHEVRIYRTLKKEPERWMTHAEIEKSSGVCARTVRQHTLKLVRLGLLDMVELFPRHRYRFSEKGHRRNKSYAQRLTQAEEVLSLS